MLAWQSSFFNASTSSCERVISGSSSSSSSFQAFKSAVRCVLRLSQQCTPRFLPTPAALHLPAWLTGASRRLEDVQSVRAVRSRTGDFVVHPTHRLSTCSLLDHRLCACECIVETSTGGMNMPGSSARQSFHKPCRNEHPAGLSGLATFSSTQLEGKVNPPDNLPGTQWLKVLNGALCALVLTWCHHIAASTVRKQSRGLHDA